MMKFGVEMVVLWRWSEKLVTVVYCGWRWSEKLVRVVVTVAADQELIIELWYHVDNNELRESRTHFTYTHKSESDFIKLKMYVVIEYIYRGKLITEYLQY